MFTNVVLWIFSGVNSGYNTPEEKIFSINPHWFYFETMFCVPNILKEINSWIQKPEIGLYGTQCQHCSMSLTPHPNWSWSDCPQHQGQVLISPKHLPQVLLLLVYQLYTNSFSITRISVAAHIIPIVIMCELFNRLKSNIGFSNYFRNIRCFSLEKLCLLF